MSDHDALGDARAAAEPSAIGRFRRWFWQPPRAHGEIEAERRVSFLELFYDLVYVVVIAQAAHELVGLGVAARLPRVPHRLRASSGSRGRTGRSTTSSMGARTAGRGRTSSSRWRSWRSSPCSRARRRVTPARRSRSSSSRFLVVMTWLWYTVRRQDRPEYMASTARYLAAMVVSIVVLAISAVAPDRRAAHRVGRVRGGLARPDARLRLDVAARIGHRHRPHRRDGRALRPADHHRAGRGRDGRREWPRRRRTRSRHAGDRLRGARWSASACGGSSSTWAGAGSRAGRARGQPLDGQRTCRSPSRSSGPGRR